MLSSEQHRPIVHEKPSIGKTINANIKVSRYSVKRS